MPTQQELETIVAGGDPDLAAMALVDLGQLFEHDGLTSEAEAAYREAAATGHPGQAPRAAFELARLLEARGDNEEALAIYHYLLSGGMTEFVGPAVCGMRRLGKGG